MFRGLCQQEELDLRLLIELEDLEDAQPNVESLEVHTGLDDRPEVREAQMDPLEEPPLQPRKSPMVDALEKPEGPQRVGLAISPRVRRSSSWWRSWRPCILVSRIPPIAWRSIEMRHGLRGTPRHTTHLQGSQRGTDDLQGSRELEKKWPRNDCAKH